MMRRWRMNKLIVITSVCLFLVIGCKNKSTLRYRNLESEISQHAEDVVFGNDTCSSTLFLYASYNCQYCRYLFSMTFPELTERYLDKGLLKVVVKWVDFTENPRIMEALQAGSCIYQFGKYQKYHDLLLANPNVIGTEDFQELLNDIMAKNETIAQCILNNNDYKHLKENLKEFRAYKFSGTPTMVINKHVYKGFMTFEKLDEMLKRELNTN